MNWTGNSIAQGMYELDERYSDSVEHEDCELCGESFLPENLEPFEKYERVCKECIELNENHKSL